MILYILDVKKWKDCENDRQNVKKLHHLGGQFLLKYALGEDAYKAADFAVGEHGKPYIKNSEIHYNISHSGNYVVLVVGSSEVGVDIQEKKPAKPEALAKRFFSPKEQKVFGVEDLEALASGDKNTSHVEWFYYIWCRKEAYGKYLGCGLNEQIMKTNVLEEIEGCYFREYVDLEGYQISICIGKEEEIEKTVSVFEGL